MSGTSADGIDVALCEITGSPPTVTLKPLYATIIAYPDGFQKRILDACTLQYGHVDEVCQINFDIGNLFADAVIAAIDEFGIKPQDVDLIGSHGQTLWHFVNERGDVTSTLQVGEAAVIAEKTNITTISNFRSRDVASGGQGAPLTAYADWLLLRHPTQWRAIQNIGGMGNVTFLPPFSDENTPALAFDTGPGNALIDTAVMLLSNGEQMYDHNGEIAKAGSIDEEWLEELLTHPYYDRTPPKTTGRELFGTAMATQLVKDAKARGLGYTSIVTTLTALTAQSITDAYERYSPAPIQEVIIGGGGKHNSTLVSLMQTLLQPARVLNHEDIGFDSDHKEALVFALLAYETWHGRTGTLPTFTGAHKATILGDITPADNYIPLIKQTWTLSL